MQCSQSAGRWVAVGFCSVWAIISGHALAGTIAPEALAVGQAIYQQDFEAAGLKTADSKILSPASQPSLTASSGTQPSAALSVDPKGRLAKVPAEFQVPASQPAYIVFDVAATKPGRLLVHLQPAEVPKEFEGNIQKEDWADPRRQYDMRALVDLKPGQWQRYAIDLNKRFFEALTRDKKPFDLAGLRIKAIGFSVNQPGEAGQQVLVDNIQVAAATPKARRAWLQALLDELRSRLEELPGDSAIARHWRPYFNEVNMQVITFEAENVSLDDWREARERLDHLLLASAKWSLPNPARAPYLVGTETSLQRVSGRNALYPFRGQIGKPVQLEAARNEYESFQIVLLPLADNLKDVTIQISDLKQDKGEGVIPSRNIAAYHQIEQWIQQSLRTTDDQVGWTPDAQLPVRGPFDVTDIQTKPLWVTLYVPADAGAGDYAGTITVRPGNAPEQVVDLRLKVYDISIPKVGQFRTQGHFGIPSLQSWYGEKYNDQVRKAYYKLMVEHRFSPTSQYSRMLSPVEQDIPWVMEQGGNVIVIGGYHSKDLEPDKIAGWYDWLVRNNYIDKAVIYIGDETDDYKGIRKKAEIIRKNWPKLRIMVGGSKPRPELEGYVDIWDPITQGGNIYDFDPKGSRDAQARGEEVFWYTCIGPRQPYANVCNDDPLTATRALWWQAWKYGITGFEYWGMNQWESNAELAKGDKPWPVGRTDAWNSRSYAWCNGDGLMVYPGPDGEPLSCNRFSVMRDAIEDWEMLFLLNRAVELAGKGEVRPELLPAVTQAKRLLDVPAEITTDLTHWSDDPQVYLKYRHELYDLLSTLRSRLGAKELDEYTAGWIAERNRWLQEKFEARVAKFQKQG